MILFIAERHLILLTIFESHHNALSESLSDPINVVWLLHGERMITREVVNGVESASPSIPKQREVLLAAIKGVIQTEPNHLQRFAIALSRLPTTSNLSLGSAIQVDIGKRIISLVYSLVTHIYPLDKYFPLPKVGVTSNTDESKIPSPSISPLIPPPSISPPISPPSVPSPVLSPTPAPSMSPSVLSPSQVPIKSSGKSKIVAIDYKNHYC